VRGVDQPAASLWKALDYLLRRRAYLLAFRRFRTRPRRPSDLARLTPGLGQGTASQLVQKLERSLLLRRLEPARTGPDSAHALTAAGARLLDILETDLRPLDALCRRSACLAGQDDGQGELRGGAWIIRKLLRQRGAMALLAQLPDGEFVREQFVSWAGMVPGAKASACLQLLMQCGLVERSRYQHWRQRNYQLSELGRQTQSLLAVLQSLDDESPRLIIGQPELFCFQPQPEPEAELTDPEPKTA
jgi:DNA-binding HxlR family transcriptional regulator